MQKKKNAKKKQQTNKQTIQNKNKQKKKHFWKLVNICNFPSMNAFNNDISK